MITSAYVLGGAVFSIAVLHTVVGPDHYLPFVVLGRAERWSLKKVVAWTSLCGLGHVASSLIIAGLGVWLGWSIGSVQWLDGIRGDLAAYGLMGFGALYMIWGIIRGYRGRTHSHVHSHGATVHSHKHCHASTNDTASNSTLASHTHGHNKTFWALFAIFVLGPCEPLVPLLMAPAAEQRIGTMIFVSIVFALTTIATMIACVWVGYMGLRIFEFKWLHRYFHAFSGFAIGASGLMIIAFNL